MKKDPAAVKLGKKGAAKRNANMTKAQKSQAARNAANRRWSGRAVIGNQIEYPSGKRSKVAIGILPNGNHLMEGVEYDGTTGIVVPRKKRK